MPEMSKTPRMERRKFPRYDIACPENCKTRGEASRLHRELTAALAKLQLAEEREANRIAAAHVGVRIFIDPLNRHIAVNERAEQAERERDKLREAVDYGIAPEPASTSEWDEVIQFIHDLAEAENDEGWIKPYLKRAKRISRTLRRPAVQTPAWRIGQIVPEEGGIYAGLVRGDADNPDYHLFVYGEEKANLKWRAARDWAKDIECAGFKDYTLPLRKEQSVMYSNVPEFFEKEGYWSCEQVDEAPGFAWYQSFYDGYYDYGPLRLLLGVRAVRRVPILYEHADAKVKA